MKISYNWLKDYLDLTIDPHQLAERLSLTGLEVEEVIEKRLDFPEVVVGNVLISEKHPNADKLRICRVDVGDMELSIVCGAANVAEGQTVAVAKVGALLPNGLKIRKSKIRGEQSEGMICSEQELGLAERSEGIWVLPDNLPVGVPLAKALNFQTDYILDLAVTTNRPDCLSHIGVARKVGALIDQHIKKPVVRLSEINETAASQVKIRIDTPQGCPRYSARVIRNIKVGKSPSWLVRRLEAVGTRSINNVVDITNYILMETGHPLHAFDFDLIEGKQIVVRESVEGEKFITLDDKERELRTGTVLICDAEKPVAIGGIMGGLNSEVHRNTVNVLLESAYFQPESIQRSSRYLGLSTEASQRFERGADPNGTIFALDRAALLIAELCGGEIYKGIVDEYPAPVVSKKIPLQVEQINVLLGTALTLREMTELLQGIDLKVQDGIVLIPTFRPDLERVADLAEEVARLYGLDNIPARQNMTINYNVLRNEMDFFVDELKNILTGMGLQEVLTGSMVNKEVCEKLTGKPIYPILNPISRDMDGMRNSLIPSIAQVIQHNRNRQRKNIRLFEMNRVFIPKYKLQELPEEELRLCIALSGKREKELWYSSRQNTDYYDIKGIVENLLNKISLDNWNFIYYSDFVIEEGGLGVQVEKDVIGKLGRLKDTIANNFEIEDEVFIADISVRKLFKNRIIDKKYKAIPRFPGIERDLALIIDEELQADKLVEIIYKNGGNLLSRVDVVDLYRGKQISEGKKSIAFRLTFQSTERTLTENEVSSLLDKILKSLSKAFNAKLRD